MCIRDSGKGVWYQDYGNRLDNTWHKYQGNVSSTILLEDVEYIEVRGLELTNDRQEGDDDGKAYNDFNVMDRTGVAGVAQNKGTINHIVLDDLDVYKRQLHMVSYCPACVLYNESETLSCRHHSSECCDSVAYIFLVVHRFRFQPFP